MTVPDIIQAGATGALAVYIVIQGVKEKLARKKGLPGNRARCEANTTNIALLQNDMAEVKEDIKEIKGDIKRYHA